MNSHLWWFFKQIGDKKIIIELSFFIEYLPFLQSSPSKKVPHSSGSTGSEVQKKRKNSKGEMPVLF